MLSRDFSVPDFTSFLWLLEIPCLFILIENSKGFLIIEQNLYNSISLQFCLRKWERSCISQDFPFPCVSSINNLSLSNWVLLMKKRRFCLAYFPLYVTWHEGNHCNRGLLIFNKSSHATFSVHYTRHYLVFVFTFKAVHLVCSNLKNIGMIEGNKVAAPRSWD